MPCVVLRSCLLNKNVRRSWMTAISLVLCVHTSAMCSLPGREAGATFPAGGGAASRAPGNPVTKPCSSFNFFCPHPSTSKIQCSDNCFSWGGKGILNLDVSAVWMDHRERVGPVSHTPGCLIGTCHLQRCRGIILKDSDYS